MVEVAAEKNSTLVLPFPVEMLRFFEAAARGEAILPQAPRRAEAAVEEADPDPATAVSEPLLRADGRQPTGSG
jgi:hypothetical protein